MKTYLLLLMVTILSLSSCKKDKDKTPIARQDVFECKVNGQLWIPEAPFPASSLTSSYQSGTFIMNAWKKIGLPTPIDEWLHYSGYFFSTGEFQLDGSSHDMDFRRVINGNLHFYRTDSTYSGKVIISKRDTVAGIIAGTFYFDAIDTTTNEVVHITEGKFDVKY